MLPVFPVIALLASVQLADVSAKPLVGVSVNVMSDPIVTTFIAVGLTGVGVDVHVVRQDARQVCLIKNKAAPYAPKCCFLDFDRRRFCVGYGTSNV